jgi:hypothetical protein
VRYSPDSAEMSAKGEESPLLEAVTRERLVKTQETEVLARAAVICKVCRLAMAL